MNEESHQLGLLSPAGVQGPLVAAAPGSSCPRSAAASSGTSPSPSLWDMAEYLASSGIKGTVCHSAWKSPALKPSLLNAVAAEEGRKREKAGKRPCKKPLPDGK